MAWGTRTQIGDQIGNGAVNGDTSDTVSLGPKEVSHVQVERTDAGTTDDTVIRVFSSNDDVTYDDVPLLSFRMDVADDIVSFLVTGVRYFQIEIDRSGTTDSILVDIYSIEDGGVPGTP